MKSEQIIKLINKPQDITTTEITGLETILLNHSYFQTAQLLLAKGLLNINSIRYNKQLKQAAAYSLKREKLFKLITGKKVKKIRNNQEKVKLKSIEEKLEIGEALQFEKAENHSFSEWLTLLNANKIEREENKLVKDFLEKNKETQKPKKEEFFKPTNVAKESLIENHNLVTPTLAKVYLEQAHYEKAISTYEKLILKYPKKSGFFAAQIKLINKLKTK